MTLAASNFLEAAWYNHTFRGTTYTPTGVWYAQCHTADPGEDGTSNVLATSGAARVAVSFDAAASRQLASSAAINFGPFGADPPAVSHLTIWDASSSGNCLAQGAVTSSVDSENGGIIRISAAALTIALTAFSSSPLADISTYLANKLLDLAFRGTAFTCPTGHKTHLYSSNPGVADSGTELLGNGYSAQSTSYGAPTDGVGSSSADIEFGPATGSNWSAVTHTACKDGSGNLLTFGAVTSFTLLVGQKWKFAAGTLVQSFG